MKNPDYVIIDLKAGMSRDGMLEVLQERYPEFLWRGSDTDTQGPSLSSGATEKPKMRVFFDSDIPSLTISFSKFETQPNLDAFKSEFIEFVRNSIVPVLQEK